MVWNSVHKNLVEEQYPVCKLNTLEFQYNTYFISFCFINHRNTKYDKTAVLLIKKASIINLYSCWSLFELSIFTY